MLPCSYAHQQIPLFSPVSWACLRQENIKGPKFQHIMPHSLSYPLGHELLSPYIVYKRSPLYAAQLFFHSDNNFAPLSQLSKNTPDEMSRTNNFQRQKTSRPIIIWDTETTGLSPTRNHIVEIAMMELECTSPLSTPLSFSSLVHPPGKDAPRAVSRVHGITNQMIQDAPSFEKVWEGVLEYVQHVCAQRGNPIFVAHNLSFDHRFLRQELARIGEPMPGWDFACSLRDVARIIWPGHSASLASLGKLLRIHNEEAHRALSDVETTSKILAKADEHLRNLSVRMGNGEAIAGSQIRHMIENAAMNRRESLMPEKEKSDRTVSDDESKIKLAQNGIMLTRSRAAKMQESSSREDQRDLEAQTLSNQFSSGVSVAERNGGGEREGAQMKYVTRMGHLWHSSRNCACLDLAVSIRRVTAVPPRFRPCVLCVSGVRERHLSQQ